MADEGFQQTEGERPDAILRRVLADSDRDQTMYVGVERETARALLAELDRLRDALERIAAEGAARAAGQARPVVAPVTGLEEMELTKRDIDALRLVLLRAEHTRRCEGFYRCSCFVGVAEKALEKLEAGRK